VCLGQQEVAAGGPGVGAVAQARPGEGVEVLGEAVGFAQGPEAGADLVREAVVAGAAQAVLDEDGGGGPDRAAPVAVGEVVGGGGQFGGQSVRGQVGLDPGGQRENGAAEQSGRGAVRVEGG
jgi:hypothetical protein